VLVSISVVRCKLPWMLLLTMFTIDTGIQRMRKQAHQCLVGTGQYSPRINDW